MRVSLNWLSDYVDISDLSPAEVAAALTSIGLEIETIEEQSKISPDVVVGEVLQADKHPNADSLRVCKVDIGDAEPLAIVCGAPNARAGIKVCVAKVGAVLPGDFKIKKSKIRGEVSLGMLCSGKELEISDEDDGIIELAGTPKLGSSAAKALDLADTIVEVNVTPNRADCLGIIGIARDLAAKLKRPLRDPSPAPKQAAGLRSEGHVDVTITDQEACGRFVALYMKDVAPVPSPAWMQRRLQAAGMRPINLLVDATNYAMLEQGQPVHAYDERDVEERQIHVRSARAGETLQTLDGQTRQLLDGDILICDANKPLALAGVMGGASSEVKADTTGIIIEVASFNPRQVRKTSRRLGLHTEASHRFERGTDLAVLPKVALRVAELIQGGLTGDHAGYVAESLVDVCPATLSKRVVALRLGHLRQFLGLPFLKREDVEDILDALQFTLKDSNEDRLVYEVPSFRVDIEREVDLIDEVARLYGIDKIPYQLPTMHIQPTEEDPFVDFIEKIKLSFATSGLRETISFPFDSAADYAALGIEPSHPLYPSLSLANPLSEQHGLLHTSLLPGLLRAIASNRRHGETGARLFECGRAYMNAKTDLSADAPKEAPVWRDLHKTGRHIPHKAREEATRPVERSLVAAALDQPFMPKAWNTPETPASFFHAKAIVTQLLGNLGIHGFQFTAIDPTALPFLHPGASALLSIGKRVLGYLGELHPAAAAKWGCTPIVLELDLEKVYDARGKSLSLDTELKRFPPVTRDLALLVDKAVTHDAVLHAVKQFKKKRNLARVQLFDVYEGANLPEGKKSMAYSFHFQSAERTLTDHEVEAEIGALTQWLTESLQVSLRV